MLLSQFIVTRLHQDVDVTTAVCYLAFSTHCGNVWEKETNHQKGNVLMVLA